MKTLSDGDRKKVRPSWRLNQSSTNAFCLMVYSSRDDLSMYITINSKRKMYLILTPSDLFFSRFASLFWIGRPRNEEPRWNNTEILNFQLVVKNFAVYSFRLKKSVIDQKDEKCIVPQSMFCSSLTSHQLSLDFTLSKGRTATNLMWSISNSFFAL